MRMVGFNSSVPGRWALVLVTFVALVSLHGCAAPVPDSVVINGFVLEIGTDWHRSVRAATQAVLDRTSDEGRQTTLTLASETLDSTGGDEDFLRLAEARQVAARSGLEMVSVHYNWTARDRTPCLAYDGIFRDAAASELPFSTVRGLPCRHPRSPGTLVRIELTQHSSTQEAAYQVDLTATADRLFAAGRFTDPLNP